MCPCLAVSGQPAPSAVLFYWLPSAQICKWCLGGGGGGECGGSGREEEGASRRRRRSAVTGCHAAPSRPSAGGVGAQPSARQEGRARGDMGVRGSGRAAPHPGGRAGRTGSARLPVPEAARPRPLCVGRRPRPRQPGSREGARPAMEPSHKDARRRQQRRLWRRRSGRPRPAEWWCKSARRAPARRHPLHALPGGRHLPLPQHFRAGTGVRFDGRDPLRPGPRR